MRELETELTRFKQRNLTLLPEGSGGYYDRIREGKSQIEAVRLEISVLEERLETTRRQVEGENLRSGLVRHRRRRLLPRPVISTAASSPSSCAWMSSASSTPTATPT